MGLWPRVIASIVPKHSPPPSWTHDPSWSNQSKSQDFGKDYWKTNTHTHIFFLCWTWTYEAVRWSCPARREQIWVWRQQGSNIEWCAKDSLKPAFPSGHRPGQFELGFLSVATGGIIIDSPCWPGRFGEVVSVTGMFWVPGVFKVLWGHTCQTTEQVKVGLVTPSCLSSTPLLTLQYPAPGSLPAFVRHRSCVPFLLSQHPISPHLDGEGQGPWHVGKDTEPVTGRLAL